MTETALRVALLLAGLGYAIGLLLASPTGRLPVVSLQGGFSWSNPDVVIGVLLTSAGIGLTLVGGSRGAGLSAVAVGVAWLAIVPATSVAGSELLRGAGQASAMLLGPALLGLVLVLAPPGQMSRRLTWSLAVPLILAVVVAALRLATYDPFFDPTCTNCAHAAPPLLVASIDERMWLDRAARALTIASAASLMWSVRGWLGVGGRARAARLTAVSGSIVAGVTLGIAAAVQFLNAMQLPAPIGQELLGGIALAKIPGGVLLAVGLGWLVVDVVRVRVRIRQLAHDITSATELGPLAVRLSDALSDPSIVVGYWFENEERYVAVDGTPIASLPASAKHDRVSVERDGQLIAAIWHRRGVEPVAIRDELTSSLLVALDNERLRAIGLANLSALQTSRARLVALQEEQRRRVERDLHDGLQQRLLAIVFDLRLARAGAERAGERRRSGWLAQAEALALSMVEEVRTLARGIYPAILSQAGLAAALASLADEASIPVEVSVGQSIRFSHSIEASVYQIVADAIADAVRGGATVVSVVVEQIGANVEVDVDHDGDTASVPVRLVDRIAAAGGSLNAEASADRSGKRLRIALPCG